LTALDEIGAQAGDIVQLIALRPIAGVDVPCHVVGEYQSFYSSGRSLLRSGVIERHLGAELAKDADAFARSVFIDSVLAECFCHPAKRAFEYKLTAVYSELLHRGGGGLIYPSVATSGGMNLAIPATTFDSQFEVVFTQVLKVESAFGYGLYTMTPLRYSCDFKSAGEINWESGSRRVFQWSPQGGLHETQDRPGWRKGAATMV
jgi:hypothetical protein